jgi:hypothetical protein
VFSYVKLPLPYYSFGIRSVELIKQRYLIASPEKALMDKIVVTPGVEFRSNTSVFTWLENDMRIDIGSLNLLDLAAMESWAQESQKKDTILQFIKTLRRQ